MGLIKLQAGEGQGYDSFYAELNFCLVLNNLVAVHFGDAPEAIMPSGEAGYPIRYPRTGPYTVLADLPRRDGGARLL